MILFLGSLGIVCHTTPVLCHFVCFLSWLHQQGFQDVDWFEVHRYVIRLENPCQLFRQLTNVGQTCGMLSSVGFSGVDILFIPPWLHGVDNPRFVAVYFQDLMCSTCLVLSSSSDIKRSALCKRVLIVCVLMDGLIPVQILVCMCHFLIDLHLC